MSGRANMNPEYTFIACGPDHDPMGDHVARDRDEAIDYARHYLDEGSRDGACVTINVVVQTITTTIGITDGRDRTMMATGNLVTKTIPKLSVDACL